MRFLLDTNLVEHGWRYRLGSEDHEPASLDVLEGSGRERLASDLRVLDTLFMRAQRTGSPEFIVAPESLRELADSTDAGAAEVLTWAQDLAAYMASEGWPDQGVSLRQSSVLADFVRPGDAVLICETNRLGCAGLLTCDYRLVRQRARIKRVAGVDVLTPSDVRVGQTSSGAPPRWASASQCGSWWSPQEDGAFLAQGPGWVSPSRRSAENDLHGHSRNDSANATHACVSTPSSAGARMRRMGGFDDEMFQAAQAEARHIHEDLLKLEAERDAASERDDDQEYGRIQEQIAEREDDFRRAQEHVDYVLSGADDDDDEDGDSGERLSVWDAADIWMSSGRDEDRMFGYTEEELRRAVEER